VFHKVALADVFFELSSGNGCYDLKNLFDKKWAKK
jgi:hypothetical protein